MPKPRWKAPTSRGRDPAEQRQQQQIVKQEERQEAAAKWGIQTEQVLKQNYEHRTEEGLLQCVDDHAPDAGGIEILINPLQRSESNPYNHAEAEQQNVRFKTQKKLPLECQPGPGKVCNFKRQNGKNGVCYSKQ